MEYMTEDQVRTLLTAEGYSPEEIDALLDKAKAVNTYLAAFQENMESLAAALRTWCDTFAQDIEKIVAQITEICYATPQKKLPRPPRYAGPRNKGAAYTQRLPRVARSCCRKMRR